MMRTTAATAFSSKDRSLWLCSHAQNENIDVVANNSSKRFQHDRQFWVVAEIVKVVANNSSSSFQLHRPLCVAARMPTLKL
jgi:hypothetical protein